MKLAILLLSLLCAQPAFSFVASMSLEDKSAAADGILRGVVIDIVPLTKNVEDSRGISHEKSVDEDFTGPHAVAIVRVTDVLKGQAKGFPGIIFIPCGYDFDESPAELTKTKDYVFFLKHMGANSFKPLDPYSMHRVQVDRVGKSGFDTGSDFEEKNAATETESYADFTKQIKAALKASERGKNQGERDGSGSKPEDDDKSESE